MERDGGRKEGREAHNKADVSPTTPEIRSMGGHQHRRHRREHGGQGRSEHSLITGDLRLPSGHNHRKPLEAQARQAPSLCDYTVHVDERLTNYGKKGGGR